MSNPTELLAFIDECKKVRSEFVGVVIEQTVWSVPCRKSSEDLLIMYDQLIERLEAPAAPESTTVDSGGEIIAPPPQAGADWILTALEAYEGDWFPEEVAAYLNSKMP